MPDTPISFVFSLLLAAAAIFYVEFWLDTSRFWRMAIVFAVVSSLATAVMSYYGSIVCATYLPLWAAGFIGGIPALIIAWTGAAGFAMLISAPMPCLWSSLLIGFVGCGLALIPRSAGPEKRLQTLLLVSLLLLLWPLAFIARILLVGGVQLLVLFTWHLEQRATQRSAWQQYLAERGLVVLLNIRGDVIMQSAALRSSEDASFLLTSAQVHSQSPSGPVSLQHRDHHYLMTITRVSLPTGETACLASFRDVTKLARVARATQSFFDLAGEGFGVCDPNGEIVLANAALKRILGYTETPGSLRQVLDYVHTDEHLTIFAAISDLVNGTIDQASLRLRVWSGAGEYRWCQVSGVYSAATGVLYFVVRDVNEKVQREQELTATYERAVEQARMLSMVEEAITVFSDSGEILSWNHHAEELYGFNAAQAVGRLETELLCTRYPSPPEILRDVVWRDGAWQGVVSRTSRQGQTKLIELRWTAMYGSGQQPRGIVEVSSDVTASLLDSSRQGELATIIHSTDDAVVSLDLQGSVLTFNPGAERLTGYTSEEVQGRSFADIISPPWQHEYASTLVRVATGTSVRNQQDIFRRKDGRSLFTVASWVPLHDHANSVYGISILARDVTAERLMEGEAERLARLAFVGQLAAGIGHELRNPLTTLRGFLQLYASNPELAGIHSHVAIMRAELDAAHEIITQFLSLARNTADVQTCNDLNMVVAKVQPLLRADAHLRDCRVHLELGTVPRVMFAEGEVIQLILNLARNGIQAMTPGGVLSISTRVAGGQVVLAVSDTGHGISPEAARQLWDPFFSTKVGGAGLGLTVCEYIVRRHGATITYDTSSRGTTFKVSFPEVMSCS